jgi:predicted transcriptional regulator
MTTAIKHPRMPKPYLLEVLGEYHEIEKNISDIIEASGYKTQYIAKKLRMPLSTFYFKRKTKSFTSKEVLQIVRLLDDDSNEDNTFLLETARERRSDEKTSAADFLNFLKK